MKRVSYIFPISHRFRYPFHVALREELAKSDIDYTVAYCAPFGANVAKKDTVDIDWGQKVPMWKIGPAVLQFAFSEVWRSDLVVIQQENRLLLNYFCQILHMLGLKKVAFFGHGRNLQAVKTDSLLEKWKRFWATRIGWWFGYTDSTRAYLLDIGYPQDKITVFQNSIDTSNISREIAALTDADLDNARKTLGITGTNVAVYVGGIYKEKRIPFLIEAAIAIRKRVPDFEFVVIGGGDAAHLIKEAAQQHPWIKVAGPRFGPEKTAMVKLGKVFLMPGLVGLGILDAFAYGTPMVTTDLPYHSPEIVYLESGVNGVMVKDSESVDAYADAVSTILTDETYRTRLVEGGYRALSGLGIEQMAARFAEGVRLALSRA